ncbi:Ca2+-binding RTX toxin-like protein [Inquilinus ginsengisoli]|uniref:calcium-binding protein n=1 Tax=Inquilinus ginsengisoli TaxID=363840 RepID=UPI003D19C01C
MSGYWLNAEIDRSAGTFDIKVGYFLDSYINPDDTNATIWTITYSGADGHRIIEESGSGTWGNQVVISLGLDSRLGVNSYGITLWAANYWGESISNHWNVFTAAYDTTPQSIMGSQFDDLLIGGAGGDVLRGFEGIDLVNAGAGSDIVDGGSGSDWLTGDGDDILIGGTGDDIITVHAAGDIVIERAGEGNDQIYAFASVTLADNVEVLNLINGFADLNGTGNAAKNQIYGNFGANTLAGLAGADFLEGNGGSDTASYYTGSVGVSVSLATNANTGGDAQGDILNGIENLSGSQGNDSLVGNADVNRLQGWNGSDALTGSGGKDTLIGGAGADRFAYGSAAESAVGANADRVADFSHAQGDKIDLSAIDADTGTAGDQAFSFIGTGLYTGVAGQLRYHSNGSITTIAGDINGDGTSDFHIQLAGAIGVVAGDFVI